MSLFICQNCGAKFAKLEKLHCETCNQYKCPACSQCYCDYNYNSQRELEGKIQPKKVFQTEEIVDGDIPVFSTVEYAKYLLNKTNLQLKGYLEFIGQRTIHSDKFNKTFLISDFMFYDSTGTLPLRIFGPVPLNYFKYRFATNRVLLEGVTIRLYKGEFELILNTKGKITILKEKQSQSLLKFVSKEPEKART